MDSENKDKCMFVTSLPTCSSAYFHKLPACLKLHQIIYLMEVVYMHIYVYLFICIQMHIKRREINREIHSYDGIGVSLKGGRAGTQEHLT